MGAWIDIVAAAVKGIGWATLPLLLLPALYVLLPKNRALAEVSRHIIQIIDSVNYCIGEVVKWALLALVLTTAFSVFALSIFGLAWTKLFQSATYFHGVVIMLGAASTLLAGQHVRVDVFHRGLSERRRAWIDFIGYYVLLAPVCLIILWDSQSFIYFAWRIFEGSSEADGIGGVFLLKTLVPLFCITMLAQAMSIALRAALCIREDIRPRRPHGIAPLFPADVTPKTSIEGEQS